MGSQEDIRRNIIHRDIYRKERNSFFCRIGEREKIRAVQELKKEIPGFSFKKFDNFLMEFISLKERCPSNTKELKQFIINHSK